jgi:L-ascorbate metabolism protein UlaG (beta-lactamase superfamily)
MPVTITRVTHACVLLDFGGQRLLTDPWFSERPGYRRGEPLAFTPQTLPPLAGVLVSHGHYDHFDIATFAAYPDHTVPLVVKRGLAAHARKAGFTNVTEVDAWETVKLGALTVTAAPAAHGVPEVTFVIEGPGTTVFFGADTLRIPELDQVGRRFPALDLALLPVNGLQIRPAFLQPDSLTARITRQPVNRFQVRPALNRPVVMTAEQAAGLCAVLKPRIAVPIHYRFTGGPVFDHLLLKYDGTPERFTAAVRSSAPATQVTILEPGQPLTV